MQIEIRKAKSEEMDDFQRVVKTALMFPSPASDYPGNELTLCAFKDGMLVTSYAALPMTMAINGGDVPFAGVTAVGTLPVARRLGCLRKVTTRHFELLHEEGEKPVTALYATRAAIYHRYGYSSVVTSGSYTVEPRDIQFIAGWERSGNFREAGEADMSVFSDLYNRFIEKRTGYLRRSEDMWKRQLEPSKREGGENYAVIYEEEGEPQGYVLYATTPLPPGRSKWGNNISIRDFIWLTPSAYRSIWDFFSRMDIITEVTWGQVPGDDPLPHLLLEPRRLSQKQSDGLYGRIVDIEKAMDKRGYNEEGTLIFKITDDMCPWNNSTWKLDTSPDGATIKQTAEPPQVEMPVSTLGLIYFGQISATEAARMGRLDVLEPGNLPIWDKVMSTDYRPACANHF
ncbi:MAG: GNAT family N-acetyltransferase [Dehalococcoidales bacterium]|nr:GNAT family N-acetyltransferase [Dehalococcoidales bacterium]